MALYARPSIATAKRLVTRLSCLVAQLFIPLKNMKKLVEFYEIWAHELSPKASIDAFLDRADPQCRSRRAKEYLSGMRSASVASGVTIGGSPLCTSSF